MNNWLIYSIGFLAQLLFSSRLLYQWLASEKNKKVVTPTIFWLLSLVASILLFVYGYLRLDFPIMLGQSITYFIYIRNLHLQKHWQKFPPLLRGFIIVFPFLVFIYYFNNNIVDVNLLIKHTEIAHWLFTLGIISQIVFTFRFIYQWIYSEKKKQSVLPIGFWILSASGSFLIILYAIFRKDPVLFSGHILALFIYIRNINIYKKQDEKMD